MDKFNFYQTIQLDENGAVQVTAVSGMTDSTITTPSNAEQFYNQIEFDENGNLKVYIKQS